MAGRRRFDAVVVGGGVAGCFAALKLAEGGRRVGLLTKGSLGTSTTEWAQGGIAAALGEDDSAELHLADTVAAGAGLCDEDAARVLASEGPRRVEELVALGAVLDRGAGGSLERSLEGGHSRRRVVHAGGAATGAEVERALVGALRSSPVELLERTFALDLLVEGGRCAGVLALDPAGSALEALADSVVLASGGAGQLFDVTTNPPGATGDGVAMALRAGVPVADVEFVQFHPTALAVPIAPRPLLSEALRGQGALLVGADGERFVDELAPRDVVCRAIAARMAEERSAHVYLDVRPVAGFAERFASLARVLAGAGLDPAREPVPVAPAAHYLCGGVLTDLAGASALPGLYAAGEVACTGVHGANRLASNSLLEGLVFGARAAEAALAGAGPSASGALGALSGAPAGVPGRQLPPVATVAPGAPARRRRSPAGARRALARSMGELAGVVRWREGLELLARRIADLGAGGVGGGVAGAELANLLTVAAAVAAAALAREETRGSHTRRDFPERDDPRFRLRLVHGRLAAAGRLPGVGGLAS
ncbi:MAG TPA: L-aspartate oxidase [Acidimicrobiales bacterium]|nr:L-aspartate oxidase [Acidimicrobiales bacterium]